MSHASGDGLLDLILEQFATENQTLIGRRANRGQDDIVHVSVTQLPVGRVPLSLGTTQCQVERMIADYGICAVSYMVRVT